MMLAWSIGYPLQGIAVDESLYGATADDILNFVQGFNKSLNTVILVNHNPTLTELSNSFCDDVIENVPTCGVFQIQTPKWSDLRVFGQLISFDYPKNIVVDSDNSDQYRCE